MPHLLVPLEWNDVKRFFLRRDTPATVTKAYVQACNSLDVRPKRFL